MSMELKELTIALCALSGPTGFETPVYDFLSDYLKPVADEIRTDSMATSSPSSAAASPTPG